MRTASLSTNPLGASAPLGASVSHDIVRWQAAPSVPGHLYRAEARSVIVLFASLG
jgi:hypothetical protein